MIENKESITAKICSFVRAYHSAYAKEKIFDDYLAYDLLGQKDYLRVGQLIEHDFDVDLYDENAVFSREKIDETINELLAPIPLSRLAFAKDEYEDFSKYYDRVQFVILGAGLDTFSFTNADSKVDIYELDHPDTAAYKKEKIDSLNLVIPKNLHFIGIDFTKQKLDDVLKASSLDVNVPTFATILGVSYYLPLDVFAHTLKVLKDFFKAKMRVVFDYPDETTVNHKASKRVLKLASMTRKLGENMVFAFPYEAVKEEIEKAGLGVLKHLSPDEIDKQYFFNQQNMSAFENIHFISAQNIINQ